MKTKGFAIALSVIVLIACNRPDVEPGTPRCVTSKIKKFETTCCENDAQVKAYTYQGKTVYVFDPGTCGADLSAEVIDSDCNSLGFLGGITGNKTINGQSFETAVYVKTVWTK